MAYGLVLEGGGAKGSYQIGACKALQELGIEFDAVTGTSIGALNGALIVQDQLEKAYELWYNISPSQVFDIEEERLEELRKLNISHDGLIYFMKKAWGIFQSKGLDITFIKKLLQEIIDEQKLRNSKLKFGFVTISVTDLKPLELFIEDVPEGKVTEYLLASANLPAFKQEKLDGKHFMDGGFYDNLPLNMLVAKGYKEIIAIRTKAMGRTRRVADQEVMVKYISSDENLGGILDFNQNQARKNLQLGYYDTLRIFQKLKGRKYYVRPKGDEELFAEFLLSFGEEVILQLGEIFGLKNIPYRRLLYEHLVPRLASLLDLGRESTYEDLVVGILEVLALEYEVERFKTYSLENFLSVIRDNIKTKGAKRLKAKENLRLPLFVKQSGVLPRAVKDRMIREIADGLFADSLLKTEARF